MILLVSSQHGSNTNPKNLDEILANITKIQNPTRILHDLASPELPSTPAHKNSDILYLTIGIIAGILLILIIILIVMCALRILQRKKFIGNLIFFSSIHHNPSFFSSAREISQWFGILLRGFTQNAKSRLCHHALSTAWRCCCRWKINSLCISNKQF